MTRMCRRIADGRWNRAFLIPGIALLVITMGLGVFCATIDWHAIVRYRERVETQFPIGTPKPAIQIWLARQPCRRRGEGEVRGRPGYTLVAAQIFNKNPFAWLTGPDIFVLEFVFDPDDKLVELFVDQANDSL